jgi:hypothetical protein
LRFLLLAFVGRRAMKTSWGICMVEDVVACLPHSPMLAFDILPSYRCLLASCTAPCWRSLASLLSLYLAMELGTSGGKTHDHRKVRKHTDYCCSTSPGGIRVIVFIFSQGKHYGIDNRER